MGSAPCGKGLGAVAAEEREAGAGRAPASIPLAVGSVVAIAAVVVAGVVLWARLSAVDPARAPGPQGSADPVPAELAGGYALGEAPDAVTEARDRPVVAARLLDEIPEGAHDCAHEMRWDGAPELEIALVTPEGLYVSQVGEGVVEFQEPSSGERWRLMCQSEWDGSSWRPGSSSVGPAADGDRHGFGGGFSCCDEHGMATASADVTVPDGAAWVLQDRGSWWLAYPVNGMRRLPLTWRFAQPRFGGGGRGVPTHVLFVDEDGREISEEWVGA